MATMAGAGAAAVGGKGETGYVVNDLGGGVGSDSDAGGVLADKHAHRRAMLVADAASAENLRSALATHAADVDAFCVSILDA